MNSGFASDVVISLVPRDPSYLLSFRRSFDGQSFDLALRRPQERARTLKERLPILLDPLRKHIGITRMTLDEAQITRAFILLDRLGYGILDVLLEDSGGRAGEVMPRLAEFLLPVFRTDESVLKSSTPVLEVEAAVADQLAWLLPLEFLPLAPEPSPPVSPRNQLERFLGFRAQIVRFLHGGPEEIDTDARGRVPVHVFAYADKQTPGIRRQVSFLGLEAAVASTWPGSSYVADVSDGLSQLAQNLISLPPMSRQGAVPCIAHFSCHFPVVGPDVDGSYSPTSEFDFGCCADGKPLTLGVFELRGELERQYARGARAGFKALFFLNACETAATGGDGLLAYLQSRNATAIVGSETLLPDQLAAEFAISFYTALLRNEPLSKAIFTARRNLIERFSNPAGLFYTFFGNPMLRVARPLSVAERI